MFLFLENKEERTRERRGVTFKLETINNDDVESRVACDSFLFLDNVELGILL